MSCKGCACANAMGMSCKGSGMQCGDALVQMQWGKSCGCTGDAVGGCAGANAVGMSYRCNGDAVRGCAGAIEHDTPHEG